MISLLFVSKLSVPIHKTFVRRLRSVVLHVDAPQQHSASRPQLRCPPRRDHGYYRAWVRPLPPRAASRLSGLVRRLRCFVPKQRHAQCRADLGQGPGHTLKNVHTVQPITNHQSPLSDINFDPQSLMTRPPVHQNDVVRNITSA